jgi:hypothetical protein
MFDRTGARRWAAAGVWFVIALAVWTVWVAQPTAVNWVAGVLVAAASALAARAVAARGLHAYTFRRSWWRLLASVPWQVVVDFGIVVEELGKAIAAGDRGSRGVFVERELDTGGDTARGRSWRAFLALAATVSPNSYVCQVDRETGRRVNHDLVRNRASERPA